LKPVVLVSSREEDVPFDLQHIRAGLQRSEGGGGNGEPREIAMPALLHIFLFTDTARPDKHPAFSAILETTGSLTSYGVSTIICKCQNL